MEVNKIENKENNWYKMFQNGQLTGFAAILDQF